MTRVLLVLAFLACNVRADEGKPVRLKAEDGRAIAGTYWAPKRKAAAHLDAIAAVRWLSKKHKRVGIVGAGLGCSAAFDAARAHPNEVAALLGMTPRAADGKLLPRTLPVAIVAHREDSKALAASVQGARDVRKGEPKGIGGWQGPPLGLAESPRVLVPRRPAGGAHRLRA